MVGVARNHLNRTVTAIERSLSRLSTGQRVSSARDDVAAYSLGVRLDAQVRGLKQASININQSQSLLMTAESAIQSQLELVQRMRELALQASNGTLNESERELLNNELQSLLEEFTRTSNSTKFNDLHLLDGSAQNLVVQTGAEGEDTIELDINDLRSSEVFTKAAGTGQFSFGATYFPSDATSIRDAMTGDLNNDGHLDLVLSDSKTSVYLGRGDGTFYRVQTLGEGGLAFKAPNLEDYNGDGILDVVRASNTGTFIHLGNGDGTFAQASSIGTYAGYTVSGDIDGDGDKDVVTNFNNVMSVFENDGTGSFSLYRTFTANAQSNMALIDLTGDGKAEIINQSGSLLEVYGMNASGSFSVISTTTSVSGSLAAVGDLDGDGDLDQVLANSGVGQLSLFINQGNGTFTPGTTLSIAGFVDVLSVEIADFNRDGNNDLIALDSTSTLMATLFSQGNGSFSLSSTLSLTQSAAPYPFAVGDFDEDGVLDLAITDRTLAQFGILLGVKEEVSGLTDLDLTSQSQSQVALEVLDNALETLTDELSQISSLHNRLDYAASSNLLSSESLSEARSKALDVDIAEETAELVRNQILQQAQVAVLAQSNLQVQVILNLFNLS